MNRDDVSPRGRELWRALMGYASAGSPGIGREIIDALPALTDEDVRLLASELQRLWHTVSDEAQRRERPQAHTEGAHDGDGTE